MPDQSLFQQTEDITDTNLKTVLLNFIKPADKFEASTMEDKLAASLTLSGVDSFVYLVIKKNLSSKEFSN